MTAPMTRFRRGDVISLSEINQLVDSRNRFETLTGDGIIQVNKTGGGVAVGIDITELKLRMGTPLGDQIPLIDGDAWLNIDGTDSDISLSEFIDGDWRGRVMQLSVAFHIGTPAQADASAWAESTIPPENTFSAVIPAEPGIDILALSFDGLNAAQFNLKVDKDDGHLYVDVTDVTAQTQVRMVMHGWPLRRSTQSTGPNVKIG